MGSTGQRSRRYRRRRPRGHRTPFWRAGVTSWGANARKNEGEVVLELTPDELLTTTRAVRKRLDFDRPVPLELVRECIEISTQAPTGSNQQGWHWVVVTDADKRKQLGEFYKQA